MVFQTISSKRRAQSILRRMQSAGAMRCAYCTLRPFFSREEARCHLHVCCPDGEAKFWLEPEIGLAHNFGLTERQLRAARRLIEEHQDVIRDAWYKHFGS